MKSPLTSRNVKRHNEQLTWTPAAEEKKLADLGWLAGKLKILDLGPGATSGVVPIRIGGGKQSCELGEADRIRDHGTFTIQL